MCDHIYVIGNVSSEILALDPGLSADEGEWSLHQGALTIGLSLSMLSFNL